MKVYLVITQDRHVDVDVEVYDNKDVAIKRGKELAKKYCRNTKDYEESKVADWLFYAIYSCEGDYVSVHEKDLLSEKE